MAGWPAAVTVARDDDVVVSVGECGPGRWHSAVTVCETGTLSSRTQLITMRDGCCCRFNVESSKLRD